jgi:primosomal protein N' (replication factor Y) (superfamily II helicase)
MEAEYAEIVLPLPVTGSYTYSIPSQLRSGIQVGSRVVVPFGARKIYTGVVLSTHSKKPSGFELKPVTEVLKDHVVEKHLLDLLQWISGYYLSNQGEVLKAAIPSSLLPSGRTMITFSGETGELLDEAEQWLMGILHKKNSIYIDKLPGKSGDRSVMSIVSSLLEKGLVTTGEEVQEAPVSREDVMVILKSSEEEARLYGKKLSRAPKQKEILDAFLSLSSGNKDILKLAVKRSDLLKASATNAATLNTLIAKNIFSLEPYKIEEISWAGQLCKSSPLSIAQTEAYTSINEQFENHEVTLLRGVTSSGKTEIYIHLIEDQLRIGKQVLYMLPEIALTTQIIERLQKHFGDKIGIYHSRMSPRARLRVWERVNSSNPDERLNLVLGVRSSVFLPFSCLGLIIIDEEHDPSYKQYDPSPRYHARDTAMMLSRLHGARTLLGSATPSVESYFNAVSNRYGLVTLTSRFGDVKMPEIVLSDMRYLRRNKTAGLHYSKLLLDTVRDALVKGEQSILFQNRRGFSPFITCGECGWVHGCSDCSVSFTYHKSINRMVCHYCGKSESPLPVCPQCGSSSLTTIGLGTEKIEEEIKTIFPSSNIARMDQDTTRKKGSHSLILSDFAGGATDILIGTQMISKGLDFENLTVVGILDADSMLNFPDFRAHERSFQLLEQVSGRAGRRSKRGKVIIQTGNPSHLILRQVIKHDFLGMYNAQIAEREAFGYPPFTRLIRINLKHLEKEILDRISMEFALALRKRLGLMVLGPEYPPVMQIQKWYIKSILIKINKDVSVTKVKELIKTTAGNTTKTAGSKLRIAIDVDPQ